MTKRTNWLFHRRVHEILDAVTASLAYHKERKKWWESEQDRTREAINKSALTTREHQYTGGADVEVVIDPTLAKRLSECQSKIRDHAKEIRQLQEWQTALEGQPRAATYELDIEDITYFRMGINKETT